MGNVKKWYYVYFVAIVNGIVTPSAAIIDQTDDRPGLNIANTYAYLFKYTNTHHLIIHNWIQINEDRALELVELFKKIHPGMPQEKGRHLKLVAEKKEAPHEDAPDDKKP
jgi:hypothetical protein